LRTNGNQGNVRVQYSYAFQQRGHCLFPSDDIIIYKHQSQKRLKPIVTETMIENDYTDIGNDCLRGNENAALSNTTCHTVRNTKLQHQVQAPWLLLHRTMSAAKTHVSANQERANFIAQYLSNKNANSAARMHDEYNLYIYVCKTTCTHPTYYRTRITKYKP